MFKDVKRHMKRVHETNTLIVQCSICYVGISKRYLTTHMRKKHSDNQRIISCEVCDYSCDEPSLLERHFLSKHSGRQLNCKFCDFATSYDYHLKAHEKSSHDQLHNCPLCDYSINNRQGLGFHIEKMHKGC